MKSLQIAVFLVGVLAASAAVACEEHDAADAPSHGSATSSASKPSDSNVAMPAPSK